MVGIDIVVIDRIERLLQKDRQRFLDRVLTKNEQQSATSAQRVAGFWAAKEAVAKALGCGIGAEIGFLDIQIFKKPSGQPYLKLPLNIIEKYAVKNTSLSISHDGGFAIAAVVIETR